MWAQNTDFGALSQTDLTKRLVPSLVWARLVELLNWGMSLMVRVFWCRNPTPVSVFIFLFLSFHNLVSSVGDCLKSSILFYFILFYFISFHFISFHFILGLISRSMVHFAKFLKKVDFVTNVVVYSFLRVQVVQLFDKVVTIMCFR